MADIPDGFEEVKPPPIPDGFEEVKPEEVQAMVKQGYEQSGELAQQGHELQVEHAFAGDNPIANKALEFAKQSGVVSDLSGLGQAFRGAKQAVGEKVFGGDRNYGGQPGYFEQLNQELNQVPTEASTATNIAGQVAGMIPAMNPILGAALAGGGAINQGQTPLQAAGQAALAGGSAAAFGAGATGLSSTPLAKIIQAASPETRLGMAQAAARLGIGGAAGAGVQAGSNLIAGQPVTQGVGTAAGLGSLMEAGGGAIHDRGTHGPTTPAEVKAPENLTPAAETPKETTPSAPQEQVGTKSPGGDSTRITLEQAASRGAGGLRRYAEANGISIDQRIIDSKINQQQMSPRQAMLSYIQERTAAPRPPGEPVPEEHQPGFQQGGLGEGTRVNAAGTPEPRKLPPGGPTLVHNLPEINAEGKTNQQLRDEAKAQGYQVPENVGRKPLLKALEDQRAASPRSEELAPLPQRTSGPVKLEPNETVRQHAAGYTKEAGIPYSPDTTHAPLDTERAAKIAKAYDAMTHDPNDPAVKASYDALKKETLDQYNYLQRQGVKIEPWTKEGQPYANSRDMAEDVRNKHLYFFQGGELPADHPLAEKLPGNPAVSYNDAFRAVHDYFGHAKEGYSFGPRGEENAWRQHSQMFSDAARPAMTAETRGQNSWVNFGPKGEANRANPANTTYAEQKAGLLPPEFTQPTERRNLETRPPSTTPEADAILRRNGIEPAPPPTETPKYNPRLKAPKEPTPEISVEAKEIMDREGLKTQPGTVVKGSYKEMEPTERPELEREPTPAMVKKTTDEVASTIPKNNPPPPDTVSRKALRILTALAKDDRGGLDVDKLREQLVNGAHTFAEVTGGLMRGVARASTSAFGSDFGRTAKEHAAMQGIKEAASETKRSAFLLDALYRPHLDKIDALIKDGKYDQVQRLRDEIEAHQPPSDPQFTNFASDWRAGGEAIKKLALKAKVPGAGFLNEDHVGRAYGMIDAKGRKPYEPGYKAPKGSGERGLAPTHFLIPRSVAGGAAESETAAAAHGMARMSENPFIDALGKRNDLLNFIHHKEMADEAVKDGTIRKLDLGERLAPGEKPLEDRLFNPPPRKFTADAKGGLLDKLNDHTVPLKERIAALKQGLKDGTVSELPPANPDELNEYYTNGVHEEPLMQELRSVNEKKAPGKQGTGEFFPKNEYTGGTEHPEEHATGEYTPTYKKGNIPEGHGLVDDALAQADKQRYAAPEHVADLFNTHLQPTPIDPKNPIFKGMTAVNDFILQTQLGLNGSHYIKLAAGASGNRASAVIPALRRGSVGDALTAARQALPVTGTAELIKAGRDIKAALGDPDTKWEPVVQAMQKAGAIIEVPKSFTKTPSPISINPKSWLDFSRRLLFEHVGDNLRRGVAAMATKDALAEGARRGMGPDHPDVQDAVRRANTAIFNTSDTLGRDKTFQSRAAAVALKSAFAFPNWQISKIRNIGQAAFDIPRTLLHGEFSPAQREVTGNLFVAALLGGAATYASTGKPPESIEDFFHPHVGSSRVTLPLPYQILTDLVYDRKDPVQFLENRLAPTLSFARQLYENRDFSGGKTWNAAKPNKPAEFDPALAAKSVARQVVPEAIQPDVGLDDSKHGKTPEDQVKEFFGVRDYREPKK